MHYIFFDIDGTLVADVNKQPYLPLSTKQTIKKLQEKGHVVAIASGRPIEMILSLAKELAINDIVSDGGYGLMIQNKIIHIDPLDKEITARLSQELLDKKIPFAFMTDSTSRQLIASSKMLNNRLNYDFENIPVVLDENFDPLNEIAYKVFIGITKSQESDIETVNCSKIMRYDPNCLAYEPDDKYRGVKELVDYYHGDIKDVIFFGDGLNDIALAKQVPFTIAMGNAIDELKEISCFVTKDILDDGIEYACKHFNLID